MTENQLHSIPDFYSGKRIFVTGGTGFLGKVLIEKLLRSCPDIQTIYILMRDKKGQEPKYRLQKLLQNQVFDRVRAEQPRGLSKIVAINGDLTSSHVGMSEADLQLLVDKVSVVFHMAATVKFDETLKEASRINILGTKKVIELCHRMKKLEAVLHVSTAFCNCNRKEVDEIVYDPPVNPEDLLHTLEWMDESLVKLITPELLQDRPNTYTYTKALSETIVVEKGGALPIAIIRPSIVTAAWKEPFPGSIDNFNGTAGIFVAGGKGLLRTVYVPEKVEADMVPVDVVSNEAIAIAWYTACYKPNKTMVYNCSSGCINKLHWGVIGEVYENIFNTHPYHECFLYPAPTVTRSKLWNTILTFFTMFVPFYILDCITFLRGRKPELISIYEKIDKNVKVLWYFVTHEWTFRNNNTLQLMEKLSSNDKKLFNFDIRTLHWPTYFQINMIETRRFLLKEDFSFIPEDRKKNKKLYIFTKIGQGLVLYILWKIFSGILGNIYLSSLLTGMYKSTLSMILSFL